MNISIICPFIGKGLGGLERVGADLCNNMAGRGHKVALLFYGGNSPAYAVNKDILIINEIEKFDKTINQLVNFCPEVILGMSSGYKSIYFLKIAKALDVPFCLHESTHFQRFCGENWAKPRKISFEDAVLEREAVCSQAYRIRHVLNHSSSFFPAYISPQVEIFPNPVNFENKKFTSSTNKNIINVGGLKKVKNIFPLLYAFKNIVSDHPEWILKIVGEGFARENDYQNSIIDFLRDNGLSQNVNLIGNTTAIEKEYQTSSIHVIMSRDENFSMCTAEAMSFGIPSIGFANSFGVSSLIDNGINGFLVNPGEEVSELQKILKNLIANPELREVFSKNAFKKSAIFDPQSIYTLWEDLFLKSKLYRSDSKLLLKQQIQIDKERSLFSRRKSINLINTYNEYI